MTVQIEAWKEKIAGALNCAAKEDGLDFTPLCAKDIAAGVPPDSRLGDISFAFFSYAKLMRKSPALIASRVAQITGADENEAKAEGGYLNVRVNRAEYTAGVLNSVFNPDSAFWKPGFLKNKKIMVEFSSPNTNKPLHLGHLRNDALGESISRILAFCGAEVKKVCIINNRGIHICKSMLAYMEEGDGKTPESEGVKSDHFVGAWYVRYGNMLKKEAEKISAEKGISVKEAEAQCQIARRAGELLLKWEAGDADTLELWRKMNGWAVDGIKQTYERTGVSFDKYYFESDTYLLGREEVLKGLKKGIFYKEEDGSVWAGLEDENLGKKALLRKDGTSLYITQDFGTAIERRKDFPFDILIYVVGSEQQYHFKVLFTLLKRLGFEWAENLYHLSYGMVNLPEGRMKTREGVVVDADDLLDSLHALAKDEIREKEREEALCDIDETAEKIALGAIHYYLLQASPERDMLFNPKESLSFNGNTGPYLQYMGARICSLLKKAREAGFKNAGKEDNVTCNPDSLPKINDLEWELVKAVSEWPAALSRAAEKYDPSQAAQWLYDASKKFSRFYHDCAILNAEDAEIARFRLRLCEAMLKILRTALYLTGAPFLEAM
ncbi:MAG: arginine--tRNA ligase [Spirochaetaceae bacterium]|jgi:arginyl-tRNA synthetase|nr:arginine--tRNA ligase [Spirochaetaceae bacterium]